MMDYEKAYKEALERAKSFQEKYGGDYAGYIFPELRESEDEKVRKFLVRLAERCSENSIDFIGDIKKADVLAWLEKQKELFESGRGLYYYDGEKTIYMGCPATEENPYDFAMSQQEKQKEQKPVEWSEEDEDMLNSCISSIEEAKENRYAYKETDGDTSYDHEIAWLKSICSRPKSSDHWKPSEEQMKALQNAIALTACDKELVRLYEQLKSIH